jgi:DNA-binding GntR family transcriptional regulator
VATLPPVSRVTAADGATAALFEAIVDGTLAPGAHLRLGELAEQFGLSMMPVREAIRRLEHLGLVEVEPHRGAFVREMTLEDLTATYETRFLLEGEAARLAAQRFTPAAAAVAREALAARAYHLELGNTQQARDAHERFHFAIYESAGNPWLVRSIMPLWRNAERYRLESMRHPELAAQRAREHEAILAAVLEGDGEAARDRTIEHLESSMRLMLDRLHQDSRAEAEIANP